MSGVLRGLAGASIVALMALALPAGAQPAAVTLPADVLGTWTGDVTQNEPAATYPVTVTLRADGGETDYPDQSCGGKLTPVAVQEGFVFLIETITRGAADQGGECINGSLTVTRAGDGLVFGWVAGYEGQTMVTYGRLTRK